MELPSTKTLKSDATAQFKIVHICTAMTFISTVLCNCRNNVKCEHTQNQFDTQSLSNASTWFTVIISIVNTWFMMRWILTQHIIPAKYCTSSHNKCAHVHATQLSVAASAQSMNTHNQWTRTKLSHSNQHVARSLVNTRAFQSMDCKSSSILCIYNTCATSCNSSPIFSAAQIHTDFAHGRTPARSTKALTTDKTPKVGTQPNRSWLCKLKLMMARKKHLEHNSESTTTQMLCSARNAKQTAHSSRLVPHACIQNAMQHQK